MSANRNITVDVRDSHFVLGGDVDAVLKNKRLLFSLKRLSFREEGDGIYIPFEDQEKIAVLQEIQDLLEKFKFSDVLGQSVQQSLSAYHHEQEIFRAHSEKARKIRNDDFVQDEDLLQGFRGFKSALEEHMHRALYPLQLLSAYHMAFSQHACNFSVPGAGKTSIVYGAYTYLNHLPEDDLRHVNKILVVGPLSSFAPWEKEYEECFGREPDCQRLSGDSAILKNEKEQHLYSSDPKELTLVSHAGMQNLEKEILDFLKRNKVLVVMDEAHRIKNAEGVWGRSAVEIAKEASARVILTGTPIPNGYEDLYNLFRFLYPFKFQDILHIHYGQLQDLTKKLVAVKDARVRQFVDGISPYFIRIKKQDLGLPGIEEHELPIPMGIEQRRIYDFIEDKYVKTFKANTTGTVKDILNKARLIRLRQAATNPALLLRALRDTLEHSSDYGSDPNYDFATMHSEAIDDSAIFQAITAYGKDCIPRKFQRVEELLRTTIFTRNDKAIVWTIFIQNAEGLQAYLREKGIESELLIGRIPQSDREDIVSKFNDPENSDFRVVIANPFSVSESISLHRGCHSAIYMERDYNAASFLQSKDRIHRVGLSEDTITHYYYLVSQDSIDSVINNNLAVKIRRMEEIINEDIPLFKRIDDGDETDIIISLLKDYATRKSQRV